MLQGDEEGAGGVLAVIEEFGREWRRGAVLAGDEQCFGNELDFLRAQCLVSQAKNHGRRIQNNLDGTGQA